MNGSTLISFVIPVFNESANIPPLFDELRAVADALGATYEIIFVDDGSTDGSVEVIRELARTAGAVRGIAFHENRGQSAALGAGFAAANGEIVITLDADMQNDPADIPRMLDRLGPYDMINGWRKDRKDTLSKRLGSRLGNAVRNAMTGDSIRDTGCSLKVMRASMLKKVKMFRGLHRFLPALMRMEGARIMELPVNHRPRTRGQSKYTNLRRGIEGFQDLLAVCWMQRRHVRTDGESL